MSVRILPLLIIMPVCFGHPHACAADTLKITITYSRRTGNGIGQARRMVISQKFHTLDDTLFREIRYDGQTGQISGYTFYFYKDGKPYSEETYNPDDQLILLLRYEYNENGNLTRIIQTGNVSDVTDPERETRYRYSTAGQMTQSKFFLRGKSAATLKYVYDTSGKLTQFTGRYKAAYDTTVRKEIRSYSYDPAGRAIQVLVNGKDTEGQRYYRTLTYSYGETEGPETITTFDGEGVLLSRKMITYLISGEPETYEETNGTGQVLKRLEYAYRTNFMDKGVQKSVLDPAIGF